MPSLRQIIKERARNHDRSSLLGADWWQVTPVDLVAFRLRLEDVLLCVETWHAWESFAGRIDGGDYDVIHPDLIEQARQNHPGVAEAAAADSFVRFAVIYGGLTPRLATMWLYRQQVWDLRTSPAEAD